MSALIAGIGNPFFGDDGFGLEVVKRLQSAGELPGKPRVVDVGASTVHLLFELMQPFDLLLIVDAAARGGEPGTLYLIDPEDSGATSDGQAPDGHALDLVTLFELLKQLDIRPPATWIVGCEPLELTEPMELSSPVQSAVPRAVEMIQRILSHGENHDTPG
jgi:hydrogenase maturation protease